MSVRTHSSKNLQRSKAGDPSSGLEKRRSYKLKLRPYRDDDDNHYTLYVRQFQCNNTSTDPEAWCFWRSALEGLRKTIGIGDEEPEELQNLLYSDLGHLAQAD
jgi:hypothetical protein